MTHVYLSLGSNIDKELNILCALEALKNQFHVIHISSTYETEPTIKKHEPSFYNAAVLIDTDLIFPTLKNQLKAIEINMGRQQRKDKHAPRPIDIDICFYGDEIFDHGKYHIPDPEVLTFNYLIVPLAEIAPDFIHPEKQLSLQKIKSLIQDCNQISRRLN